LGFTLAYLSGIVLIPLAALILKSAGLGWADIWRIATDARTLAALRLSFGASFIAASINAVFGLLLAWVLVRYSFPGRRLVDAMIDLPFALPTAAAGIALTALYAPNGWIGQLLAPLGLKVAYTPSGCGIALTCSGRPFIVRRSGPVLRDLGREIEEAAATLGASRGQGLLRVLVPSLMPAILTGYALARARSIGEYGSVILIAGNIP